MRFCTELRFLLAACLFLTVIMGSVVAQAATVRDIKITGTERIDPATVLSYLPISVNDKPDRADLDRALKELFGTGLFADVSLSVSGSTLIVDLVENPIINEIVFEGNSQLDDEELEPEIQLRPRQVFTRTKVQEDVSRLYQLYRRNGRFSATIEPKLIRLDQNRVNLVFEVEEGPVTKVRTIRFVGNERFDDAALRSEISTKETEWYRFISVDDRYDPDRIAYDQELLRRFYLSNGYADFRIISAIAELADDRSYFFLTFTVDEGERYRYGDVKIDSKIRNFDPEILKQSISLQQDDWYDVNEVETSIDNMTSQLGDLQYAFVNVNSNLSRNREENIIDITFRINETPRVFVERINIDGNSRTLDKVIRREMEVVEGDPFNRTKISRSIQNIRNLNYFETVDVDVKPGTAADKSSIDVNVTEKSTGELSVGAGFSTTDGLLADFRIQERNLLGRGQLLGFGVTLAGERTEFDVSFTEPHFMNRDISAGFDVFHITRDLQDESSFDQERTGGALRVGYPLSKNWRQTLRLRAERNEVTDVETNASRFIREQEGERDTVGLSQRVTYDNRDSTLFPTDGMLFWLGTEVTGFGADSQYVSGNTGASFYYPVTDNVVFNLLGEVGAIEGYSDTDVAINERYFLGGNNLRGFEQAGVGPRDTFANDALGGKRYYRGTAEFTFPLYGLDEELGIKAHAFSDFGSLFELEDGDASATVEEDSSIRSSVGLGLSWRSPFGPLRIDVSEAISKEDYDETEVFRFNFGTRF